MNCPTAVKVRSTKVVGCPSFLYSIQNSKKTLTKCFFRFGSGYGDGRCWGALCSSEDWRCSRSISITGWLQCSLGGLSCFYIAFPTDSKTIIMGEFNINVLQMNDPMIRVFNDTLGSFGLNWSVNWPTRVTVASSTTIDNVITNIVTSSTNV